MQVMCDNKDDFEYLHKRVVVEQLVSAGFSEVESLIREHHLQVNSKKSQRSADLWLQNFPGLEWGT